jgi:hypothetical protein
LTNQNQAFHFTAPLGRQWKHGHMDWPKGVSCTVSHLTKEPHPNEFVHAILVVAMSILLLGEKSN